MTITKSREVSSKERLLHYLKEQDYKFITSTPLTHQRVNDRKKDRVGETLRDAFGWNIPFSRALLPEDVFAILERDGLVTPVPRGWKSNVRASCVGQDLFLHSGYPTTEPDAVFLGPDSYRFCRLIQQTLANRSAPIRRALDVGCGSGVGGVAIARNATCDEIIWSDISDKALDFCSANLRGCGFSEPQLVRSDLFAALDGTFDLIVANPPYLNDPLQRAYRHGGGALGSRLSVRIAVESVPRLSPGGTLILYTGSSIVDGQDRLRSEIEAGLAGAPVQWSYEEIDPDVFGEELELTPYQSVERIAVVALVMTKVGDG